MDQLIELVVDRKRQLPFTKEGELLYARPVPLQLALKMTPPGDNDEVQLEPELMAEIVSHCVRTEDGERAFTVAEILDGDTDKMVPLFEAVMSGLDDAEKN